MGPGLSRPLPGVRRQLLSRPPACLSELNAAPGRPPRQQVRFLPVPGSGGAVELVAARVPVLADHPLGKGTAGPGPGETGGRWEPRAGAADRLHRCLRCSPRPTVQEAEDRSRSPAGCEGLGSLRWVSSRSSTVPCCLRGDGFPCGEEGWMHGHCTAAPGSHSPTGSSSDKTKKCPSKLLAKLDGRDPSTLHFAEGHQSPWLLHHLTWLRCG